MIQIRRRRLAASFLAALAVFLTPALLFAHARLLRSTPGAGASVTAPAELSFWFSETPELRFTHIRLLDSAATEIPLGAPQSGGAMSIISAISRPLAPGRYKVEWHTAASDGHSSSGTFTFTVVGQGASPAPTAAAAAPPRPEHAATSQSNAPLDMGRDVAFTTSLRWAELVALLTLIGLAIYRLSISRDAKWSDALSRSSHDRALRLARAVLILLALAVLSRGLSEANLVGTGGSRLQSLGTMVQFTRWGHGWAVGAGGVIVAAIGLVLAARGAAGWVVASIGIVAVCVGESLTGHSAASAHAPLAIAADVAHQLGAGGWLGGLVAILLCGLPALRKLGDAERAAAGTRLLRAYHGAAMECVAIVVASAIVAAWLRLPRFDALWTSDYGLAMLRKIVFVVILLLFGFYHWRRIVMRGWTEDTGRRFRRTAAAELLVGAIVVALTAVLASTSLPT